MSDLLNLNISGKKPRILIVDDDPYVGKSIELILRAEPYEIVTVESGQEAIKLLEQETFDVILTDIKMEDVDGLQLLDYAKRSDPDVIVILFTGHSSFETAIKGMRRGAFDYLIKPCSKEIIKMTVKRGVEKRNFEKERKAIINEIERRAIELADLNSIANILASSLELENILNKTLQTILKIFDIEEGFIALIEETKKNSAIYYATSTFYEKKQSKSIYIRDNCLCGLTLNTQDIFQLNDLHSKKRLSHCWSKTFQTVINAPLMSRNRILGFISLASQRKKNFEDHHKNLLKTICNQIAMAVANAQLFKKVQEERLRLKAMIESMAEGIILLDSEFNISVINPAAREMLRFINGRANRKKLLRLGKISIEEIIKPDHYCTDNSSESNRPKLCKIITEKEPNRIIHVSSSSVQGVNGQKIGYVIVLQDMTESYNTQEQLYLASRMASIGELASGIAHEINNPLTSIVGFTQLMLMEETNEEFRKNLQKIYDESIRTKNIVKNLLGFARNNKGKRELSDINFLIKSVIKLFGKQPELNNIRVILNLWKDSLLAIVDPGQIQQVFLNIIQNAIDAITLSHKGDLIKIKSYENDGFIFVEIEDNGPGIPREIQKKIFNPFFTTKEVGQGTGLGLSISHKIIQSHGGSISVKSQINKGAIFIIKLPEFKNHVSQNYQTGIDINFNYSN